MVVPSPMTNDQRVVKPPVHYHPPVVASPSVVILVVSKQKIKGLYAFIILTIQMIIMESHSFM